MKHIIKSLRQHFQFSRDSTQSLQSWLHYTNILSGEVVINYEVKQVNALIITSYSGVIMAEGHQGCSNQFQEDCCVICKLGFKDERGITVSRKGILTIVKYSEKRGWLELGTYLTECISVTPIRTVLVHKKCRRDFTDQKRMMEQKAEEIELPSAKRLRSSSFLTLYVLWKTCHN